MDRDAFLRKQLADMLRERSSHARIEEATAGFPTERRGTVPAGLPYSAWMVLEHIRTVQWDFLNFCRDPGHVSPPWPGGYWPEDPVPPGEGSWDRSIAALKADLEAMAVLVEDPATDIWVSRPWMDGWTILREVLLSIDHLAYHLGEIVVIRRALGGWPAADDAGSAGATQP